MTEQQAFDRLLECNPHLPFAASNKLRRIWALAWKCGRREGYNEGLRAGLRETAQPAKQPISDFLDAFRKLGIKL